MALVPAVYPCGLESHVGFGSGPALARHDMAKELAPCHAANADAVSLYISLEFETCTHKAARVSEVSLH